MRTIQGTIAELLAQGQKQKNEDYLFIRVMDKSPVYMPTEQLRTYYPNLLAVNCDWLNPTAATGEDAALREQLLHHKIDEAAVFEQFMKQICGEGTDESDRVLFLQVLNEVKNREGE
jgi:exonuclease SbcD